MNGLLIEFSLSTGKRAGNISPKDPKLRCLGWQDLESIPAREVRMIEDDRDINQYKGIKGVTILRGKEQIWETIQDICRIRYKILEPTLFVEHLRQRAIDLTEYEGQDPEAILKDLMENKNIIGIMKKGPREPIEEK